MLYCDFKVHSAIEMETIIRYGCALSHLPAVHWYKKLHSMNRDYKALCQTDDMKASHKEKRSTVCLSTIFKLRYKI